MSNANEGSSSRTAERRKSKIFISYAREDVEFADQLVAALHVYGFEPIIDRERLVGGESFAPRLFSLILAADAFIYVLSEASTDAHSYCLLELKEAQKLSKRILPLIGRPLEKATVSPDVSALDYIYFYSEPQVPRSGFGSGLQRLVDALNTDVQWVREHTRLAERAADWVASGRSESHLLTGDLVVAAQAWLEAQPPELMKATPDQLEYISASDIAEKRKLALALQQVEERELALAKAEKAHDRARRFERRTRVLKTFLVAASMCAVAYDTGWSSRSIIKESIVTPVRLLPLFWPLATSRLQERDERDLKPGMEFRECLSCPTMVVIGAGDSSATEPELAVSKHEITFDDWDACVAHGHCEHYPRDNGWGRGQQPVIQVNWNDAKQYVAWLSQTTGNQYRLLTEAEWVHASSVGQNTLFPWGNTIGSGNANCNGCNSEWDAKQPAPVGSFPPNGRGLYDIIGNVWEWVEDCYEGSECSARVIRGGSWVNDPEGLISRPRYKNRADLRFWSVGFRVARSLNIMPKL